MAIAVDGLKLTRTPVAVPVPTPTPVPSPGYGKMAGDLFRRGMANVARHEDVYNNGTQLPGAGANTLPEALPFFHPDRILQAIKTRFPAGFGVANTLLKYGGVVASGASFLWSGYNLITTWDEQTAASKVLNTTSTLATGAGTVAGVAWLRTGSVLAGNLMGGFLGVAGTIFQGIKTFKEFNDPTKNAGQRGLALTSTLLTGAGTVLMFIPGGQVIGVPLMIAGGILGAVGDWLGKFPVVNQAFEWVGDKLGKAASAVGDFAKGVGDVASSAWHGLTHLFG
ncbi:MAG: hypothetical protein JWM80_2217 [Cyanobacteria bacterium RYN_339]|nr:hypothetical protein [Cyanobacteria bacterium RYN_339]